MRREVSRTEVGSGILYVVSMFPKASERFIQREIAAVRRLGVRARVFTLAAGSPDAADGSIRVFRPWRAAPTVLFAALRHPIRARHLVALCGDIARGGGLRAYLSTLRCLPASIYFCAIVATDPPRIVHAHFALAPATIARMIAAWCEIPWGLSVHAHDLYVAGSSLSRRLATARHILACSEVARQDLRSRLPSELATRVHTVHHGVPIDGAALVACPRSQPLVPTVLAVGRFVEKKGYAVLIDACARLRDRGFRLCCELIGAGPLAGALREQVAALGLEDRVSHEGWISPEELERRYRSASVLAIPSVVARDGDRDNVPNVLLEALATSLPVVASDLPALRALLRPTSAALMVPAGDADALAAAIHSICTNPGLAARLSAAGRALVAARFDLERNARDLLEQLERSAGGPLGQPREARRGGPSAANVGRWPDP